MTKPIPYVALDLPGPASAIAMAKTLSENMNTVPGQEFGFKINLDTLLDFGADPLSARDVIREMKSLFRPVFLDLKMWNGGRTMSRIAERAAELGIDIINMYPHAGAKLVERVAKSLEGSQTKLFTLTVLTHYTDEDTRKLYGKNLSESTRMLAQIGIDAGAKGIILPGTQLDAVRDIKVPKLVPGIRPGWFSEPKTNDQEQTVTVEEAIRGGASYLVIGSPILKATNPVDALRLVLDEMAIKSR